MRFKNTSKINVRFIIDLGKGRKQLVVESFEIIEIPDRLAYAIPYLAPQLEIVEEEEIIEEIEKPVLKKKIGRPRRNK